MTFVDLVTVATFAVVCLIVFLIGDTITGGRRIARRIAGGNFTGLGTRLEQRRSVVGWFTHGLAEVFPQSSHEVESIERDLKRAGYYTATALVEYMATRNALMIGILIVTGVLAVIADPGTNLPESILVVGLFTTGIGYALPRIVLGWQARNRVDRIQRGLPDALDIITMCITGGLPLNASLKRVAGEIQSSHPDVAVEFEIIRKHAEADTMPNALRQFAARVDTPDVNALAALVSQTERIGTHVATAVCDYADSVRRMHRQRAEERANKTTIKLLFPVILCLAPPIYILLCGPPVLQLKNFVRDAHQPGGVLETTVP